MNRPPWPYESETRRAGSGIISGNPALFYATTLPLWFQKNQYPPPFRYNSFWWQAWQFPYGRD